MSRSTARIQRYAGWYPVSCEDLADDRPHRWWHTSGRRDEHRPTQRVRRARRRMEFTHFGSAPYDSRLRPAHLAVALLSLVMPFVTLRYAAQWKKSFAEWRTGNLVTQADDCARRGDSEQERSTLVHAAEENPSDPRVLRRLARTLAEEFPNEAKTMFCRLMQTGAATSEDELQYAALLVRLGEAHQGMSVFEKLAEQDPANTGMWNAWAQAWLQLRNPAQARAILQVALQHAPRDSRILESLADVMLAPESQSDPRQAVDLLIDALAAAQRLAQQDVARRIAGKLCDHMPASLDARMRLADLLDKVTDTPLRIDVAAAILRYENNPDERQKENALGELENRLERGSKAALSQRIDAARLLQNHGMHSLALNWIPVSEAVVEPGLLRCRMDSLMALGLWRDAGKLAEARLTLDPDAPTKLMKALGTLAGENVAKDEAKLLLRNALSESATRHDSSAYVAVGHAALDMGLNETAATAFARALQYPDVVAVPIDEYVLAVRRAGIEAADVLKVLKQRRELEPNRADLWKATNYLNLLCGRDLESVLAEASRMQLHAPADPYLRFLVAFGKYRLGDYAGASATLSFLPSHVWHRGEAAVISAILAGGGKVEQASAIQPHNGNDASLFREERSLAESWQIRRQSGNSLLSRL